eukprot:Hpha_TRINITY_DN15478_c3_g8::TRINITY_DN15478_c3_g8_i1::g.174233::m.174233
MVTPADRAKITQKISDLSEKVNQLLQEGGNAADERAVAAMETMVQQRSRLMASQPSEELSLQQMNEIERLVSRYNRLAVAALRQGDLPRTLAFLQRAEARVTPGDAIFKVPGGAQTRAQLQATTLNNLACLARRRELYSDAVEHLQAAAALEQTACGAPKASTLVNLAACLTSEGNPREAVAQCSAAIPLLRERLDSGDATEQEQHLLVVAWHNLGLAQLAIPRAQGEASESLHEAAHLARKLLGHYHPTTEQAEASLARVIELGVPHPPRRRSAAPLQPAPPSDPPPTHRRRRSKARGHDSPQKGRKSRSPRSPPGSSPGVHLPTLRKTAHVSSPMTADAESTERVPHRPDQGGAAAGALFSNDGSQPLTKAMAREQHRRRQSELRRRSEKRRQQSSARQQAVEGKRDAPTKKRKSRGSSAAAAVASDQSGEEEPGAASASELLRLDGARGARPPHAPHPPPAQEPLPSDRTEAAPGEEEAGAAHPGATPTVPRRADVSPVTFADIKEEVREAALRSGAASRATSRPSQSTEPPAPPSETKKRFEGRRRERERRLQQESKEEGLRRAELERERKRMAAIFAVKEQRQREIQARLNAAASSIQKCFVGHLERRRQRKQRALMAKAKMGAEQQEAVVQRYAQLWLKKTEGARALARRLVGCKLGLGRVQMGVLEKSSVTIQRAWRLKAARLAVRRRQLLRRTLSERRQVAETRRQAATRIQALFRGNAGRKRAKWAQFERLREAGEVAWKWWLSLRDRIRRHNAWVKNFRNRSRGALVIQTRWRGYRGKLQAAERRLRRRIGLLRFLELRAAIDIQRVIRGRLGRKKAAKAHALRAHMRRERAEAALKVREEEEAAEVARLQLEIQEVQAKADAARKARLPAAQEWLEQQRQVYLETVVDRQAARFFKQFVATPPARHREALVLLQSERIQGFVRYARVFLATVFIQRRMKSWILGMSKEKRAHCRGWRRRLAEERLERQKKQQQLKAKAPEGCRAAAEVRALREQHLAEITALETVGPTGPKPPARAADVQKRVDQELARAKEEAETRNWEKERQIEARLQRDVEEARKMGDAMELTKAQHKLMESQQLARDWGLKPADVIAKETAQQAEERQAAIRVQSAIRSWLARARVRRLMEIADRDAQMALEWRAAGVMQGLWHMRQAKAEVQRRKEVRAEAHARRLGNEMVD